MRVARGGEMLAPGTAADPVQFIDVRDLADFMRVCVERKISGRYNLCNPPGAVTMGELLETSKRMSKSNASFTWAKPVVSRAAQAAGERRDSDLGADRPARKRARRWSARRAPWRKGLRFRDLDTTIKDTLAWHEQRPAEQKAKLRAGLTTEREAELLKQLKSVA